MFGFLTTTILLSGSEGVVYRPIGQKKLDSMDLKENKKVCGIPFAEWRYRNQDVNHYLVLNRLHHLRCP